MSATGPELPPHLLAKRKRQEEEAAQHEDAAPPGAKRQKSPPAKASKPIGPAAPPAPLDERPSLALDEHNDDSESSEDDDFGPSLPGQVPTVQVPEEVPPARSASGNTTGKDATTSSKRDEWMMVPPKQDDLSARLDPTKPRARGFNTGKGARGPTGSGADHDTWTETPEQKRQRLENQVMGVKPSGPGALDSHSRQDAKQAEDKEKAARLKEARGKSLYDMHQKRSDKEEEDDPSRRAFDREKDIGGGMKIGNKQRKEMLNKASGFGSKFSSGSFL